MTELLVSDYRIARGIEDAWESYCAPTTRGILQTAMPSQREDQLLNIPFDLELPSIGEYRMCQATIRRLSYRAESCQVRKVASLLTEPLRCLDGEKMVRVIGKIVMPEGSAHTKLIVEKMTLHDDIAARAPAIHKSDPGGSAEPPGTGSARSVSF